MNYEYLNQKIVSSTYEEDINPVLAEDNSNFKDFFAADVIGSKRFVQNFGGYPRSEIAQINAEADIMQQANLLAELTDYSPSSNPNAGLSDVEIMLGHKSKYLQTPNEVTSWLEGQLQIRDAKRVSVASKPEQESTISFENNENVEL